jgi:hypothetical protein
MSLAMMPKVSVNKNGNARAGEIDVERQTLSDRRVHSVAKAEAVERAAQQQLRLGVA